MKLVVLMYLEEDGPSVEKLLKAHQVVAYSELPVTGHGMGTAGWYGTVAPYESRMLIAFVPADKAEELAVAVSGCPGCSDPNHPIHAWVMDVEKALVSGDRSHSHEV